MTTATKRQREKPELKEKQTQCKEIINKKFYEPSKLESKQK